MMPYATCCSRRSFAKALPLLVWLGIVLLLTSPALAQRRGRASVSRAIAAHKQQEITQLQAQIDGARKLLDSLNTQGQMTQAQIDAARQSAMSARRALKDAEKADNEASKKIRKIEDEILDAQPDDSEYTKAEDHMQEARRALDKELHRVLGRPDTGVEADESTRLSELAHLTAEEREELAKSPKYMEQKEALHQTIDVLNTTKKKLFQASDEWKTAVEEHHKIEQDKAQEERSAKGAANDNADARNELRTAAQIAASTQATLAHAQARLHALGGKEKSTTPAKTPGKK